MTRSCFALTNKPVQAAFLYIAGFFAKKRNFVYFVRRRRNFMYFARRGFAEVKIVIQ